MYHLCRSTFSMYIKFISQTSLEGFDCTTTKDYLRDYCHNTYIVRSYIECNYANWCSGFAWCVMLGTKIGIAKVQKNARRKVKPNLRCAYFRLRIFFCWKISSRELAGRQIGQRGWLVDIRGGQKVHNGNKNVIIIVHWGPIWTKILCLWMFYI